MNRESRKQLGTDKAGGFQGQYTREKGAAGVRVKQSNMQRKFSTATDQEIKLSIERDLDNIHI